MTEGGGSGPPAGRLDRLAEGELSRRILEAMPGGVVHVDKSGAILAGNAEALRVLGLSHDALTNKYTVDFETTTIWEDGSPCPASEYPVTRALMTGERQGPATIGVRRPDGNVSWAVFTAIPVFDGENQVTGAVVTFIDVTQRRRTEAALRASEELLRSVLASSPNPIITVDREGKLLFVTRPSPAYLADRSKPTAEDYVVPEDRPKVRATIERVLATGNPESYEASGLSGSRWLVHAGPRYEGESIAGVTLVAWDVTKQRELERRVAIADRMASIGQLAASVAHEVNNPLTYVLANLEWLRPAVLGNPLAEERLDTVIQGARRIRDVVADLRTFAHVSDGRRVLVDVGDVIDTALRMAQGETRCRARVTTTYGELPPVFANEGRLGQLFLNLIINAAQAIPEGHVDDNEIAISTSASGDRIVVEIRDTGIGIPEDLLAHVFEPFVTTKPRGAGTGLGLYICREVVASLGGTIEATSKEGEGTTIRISIPITHSSRAAVHGAAEEETPPPRSKRKLRVLVVDDEPAIVSVLRTWLADHDVMVAESGRHALTLLLARDFDVAFVDLVMPDVTGMDVFEQLRLERPGREKTLVFMTAGAFTTRAREFVRTTSNEVMDKPFSQVEMTRVIDRVVR